MTRDQYPSGFYSSNCAERASRSTTLLATLSRHLHLTLNGVPYNLLATAFSDTKVHACFQVIRALLTQQLSAENEIFVALAIELCPHRHDWIARSMFAHSSGWSLGNLRAIGSI